MRGILYKVGAGLGALVLLWLFFYAPFMHVRGVRAETSSEEMQTAIEGYVTQQLDKRAYVLFSRRHKWFLRKDRMATRLMETLPLNAVSMDVDQRELVVTVDEKIRQFYLLKQDVLYAIDREGDIVGVVDDLERARISVAVEQGGSIPIIYDERPGELEDTQSLVSPEALEQIVLAFDAIAQQTLLTPTRATLVDYEGRIDITTDAGVTLYMSVSEPVEDQIKKLTLLIQRKLVDIAELTYIDLRFANRLFYN